MTVISDTPVSTGSASGPPHGAEDFTQQRPVPDNLVPDLNDINAFTTDKVASAVLARYAPWSERSATDLGAKVWHPKTLAAARDAQRYAPELRTLDRVGNRLDVVEFHPTYHELMSMAFGAGMHALAWTSEEPGGHTARAVQSYLWNQVDGSTACPAGMAYAAFPILRDQPELARWAERVAVHGYDCAYAPIETKSAATIAYAVTERQSGSDLRANVTVARPAGSRTSSATGPTPPPRSSTTTPTPSSSARKAAASGPS